MTMLHGGVYHHTATPHKSGNKMKKRRKSIEDSMFLAGPRFTDRPTASQDPVSVNTSMNTESGIYHFVTLWHLEESVATCLHVTESTYGKRCVHSSP